MLLVVLGAGASNDSAFSVPATNEALRPPLANELFGHRSYMHERIKGFETLGRLAAEVEGALHRLEGVKDSDLGVEAVMERYLARATDRSVDVDSRIRNWQMLVDARYYISSVVAHSAQAWREVNGSRTHYELLTTLLDTEFGGGKEGCIFVTFNYDTLLEHALRAFGFSMDGPDDWIRLPYPVFKLHGSVGWGRRVWIDNARNDQWAVRWAVTQALEAGKDVLTDHYSTWLGDVAAGGSWIPAIAVPLAEKDDFECPDSHVATLSNHLRNVTRVLAIGWKGQERSFADLMVQELPKGVPFDIMGNRTPGEVAHRLRGYGVDADYRVLGGGFTPFLAGAARKGAIPGHEAFDELL